MNNILKNVKNIYDTKLKHSNDNEYFNTEMENKNKHKKVLINKLLSNNKSI